MAVAHRGPEEAEFDQSYWSREELLDEYGKEWLDEFEEIYDLAEVLGSEYEEEHEPAPTEPAGGVVYFGPGREMTYMIEGDLDAVEDELYRGTDEEFMDEAGVPEEER